MNEYRGPHNNETEICLLTYDGAQHLKLHGWLKRHKVPIRAENIINDNECFGVFTVIIDDDSFYDLEEENTEKALFMDLQIINRNDEDKGEYKINPTKKLDKETLENLKSFMFNFEVKDPDEIDDFLSQTNETSLALFRRNDDFIEDYVRTLEMEGEDKIKDIDFMIRYFLEDERYEDCALLQDIKKRVIDHYEDISIKDLLS
jgi:hypothetical protein|tara:strand:+ start:1303 stop:1911 length:609 start_codon:yes stop_codon:yes gene_type:complete